MDIKEMFDSNFRGNKMKKYICAIVCVLLTITLCACGRVANDLKTKSA